MFVGITLNSGIIKQVNDYNPHGHKVRSSKTHSSTVWWAIVYNSDIKETTV